MDEWIDAGAETDIAAGPRATVVGNRAVVLWRTEGGTVSALDDACPHEGNRLSEGVVDGEDLICIYHGFTIAADGWCDAAGSAARCHDVRVRDGRVLVRVPESSS
ncbi:hypothetical protein FRACA_2220004 [Frankia canadensis]|uniref:Rieske domain-containing protein n=1 Tax=Frankia canadensis TaxID=1836972 RepID=A0A2I2KR43_9ACTN|nr:Rieske 2Fe-2S domain-containing protein [Frankia canadensis]SNQ48137.1 hypothetical protein FRACA_2220004 [Frankia canadensis]SOU55427.1 hypothetical protein FRACA_2220004 [Frankia canadensis]